MSSLMLFTCYRIENLRSLSVTVEDLGDAFPLPRTDCVLPRVS